MRPGGLYLTTCNYDGRGTCPADGAKMLRILGERSSQSDGNGPDRHVRFETAPSWFHLNDIPTAENQKVHYGN